MIFTFHAVFLSVGCIEHSDSESDFELQKVDPGLAGLSDVCIAGVIELMQHLLCTLNLFMLRLLGRLNGVLILADCFIGLWGY